MNKSICYMYYFFVTIFIILTNTVFMNQTVLNSTYSNIINPLVWLVITILGIIVTKELALRLKKENEKYKTVLIVTLVYIIIYLLSGLFLGFLRSIYSHTIIGIIRNLYSIMLVSILIEITRNNLIKIDNSKKSLAFITVCMIIANIGLSWLLKDFKFNADFFEYMSSYIVPSIFEGVMLTYVSLTCGIKGTLSYILPMKIMNLMSPIVPDLDWFLEGACGLILPIVIFIQLNYVDVKTDKYSSKVRIRKSNPITKMPILVVVVIFVAFMAGFLNYYPVTIATGSMMPGIQIGDAVIIHKLNENPLDQIKMHDIVAYRLDNRIIVHRVVEMHDEFVITKGDNNNANDKDPVYANQIVGVVNIKIPKIGLPSIWLNKLLYK